MNEQEPPAWHADVVQSSGDAAGKFGSRLEGSIWFTPACATWKPTSAACGFTGLLWRPQKVFFSTGTFAPSLGDTLATLLQGRRAAILCSLCPIVLLVDAVTTRSNPTEPPELFGSEISASTSAALLPKSQHMSLCFQAIPAKAQSTIGKGNSTHVKGSWHDTQCRGSLMLLWAIPLINVLFSNTRNFEHIQGNHIKYGTLTALSRITSDTAEPESEESKTISELSQYKVWSPALTWGGQLLN